MSILNPLQGRTTLTYDTHGNLVKKTDANNNTTTYELYYYRARYYDAGIQRFLSRDPTGFSSRDFNFYRYVDNDPINLIDPMGLESMDYNGDGYVSGDELSQYFRKQNTKHNQKRATPVIQQNNNTSQGNSDGSSSFFSGLLDFITPSQNAGGAIRTQIYIPNNADISTPEAQKSLRDCVNTNVFRNAQAKCKSMTYLIGAGAGAGGGKDLGQSEAGETGIFYSETCRRDETKEMVRGYYWAGEQGVGLSKGAETQNLINQTDQ